MKTLKNIRPEFGGIAVGNSGNDYIPAIMGGINEEEIWFDKSNVDSATLERISLLVKAAYDLGISHAFEAIDSIREDK